MRAALNQAGTVKDAQSVASSYGVPRIRTRLAQHWRQRGALSVAASCAQWSLDYVAGLPWPFASSESHFVFDGQRLPYLYARHNRTWFNERAVEIPIVKALLDLSPGARVLEVGNVLSHYFDCDHTVLDRYERAPGVINIDVLEFRPSEPYDLIVSISTIEHVGWDEHPREPARAERAVHHLCSLLARGGRLVITIPAQYNPYLDAALADGRIECTRIWGMERDLRRNHWREVAPAEAARASYDSLLYFARGLLVCEFARDVSQPA
jgi:SAM-dependent methyltransferase